MKEQNQDGNVRREVLFQMGRDVSGLAKSVGRAVCNKKNLSYYFKGLGVTASLINVFPYAIPTTASVVKKYLDIKEGNQRNINSTEVGGLTGLVFGSVAFVAQIFGYMHIAYCKSHPEVFLIPVATNAVSGAYELGKYWYGNAKKRVTGHGRLK